MIKMKIIKDCKRLMDCYIEPIPTVIKEYVKWFKENWNDKNLYDKFYVFGDKIYKKYCTTEPQMDRDLLETYSIGQKLAMHYMKYRTYKYLSQSCSLSEKVRLDLMLSLIKDGLE